MLKLTYDYVKRQFENRGYELISKEYIGSNMKLQYRCPNHPDKLLFIKYSNFSQGSGCPYCANVKLKTQDEYVIDLSTSTDFKIISLEPYINVNTEILHKCLVCKYEWKVKPAKLLYDLWGCPCCNGNVCVKGINDIVTKLPQVEKWLLHEEDKNIFQFNNNNKVELKCPDCNHIFKKTLHNIYIKPINCPKCGDGISYPEKLIFSLLSHLGVFFEYQRKFIWSNNKIYDFYIKDKDILIECHGIQHYENSWFLGDLSVDKQKENDANKKTMALKNGINNYVVIDARYSDFEFIKSNILKSELSVLLDLNNVNWNDVEIDANKSMVNVVCSLWNDGQKIKDIQNALKICNTTIRKYLKIGNQINLCVYNSNLGHKRSVYQSIKCVCENTKIVYESFLHASKECGINKSTIALACKGQRKSAGKTISGEKCYWSFYDSKIHMENDGWKFAIPNGVS